MFSNNLKKQWSQKNSDFVQSLFNQGTIKSQSVKKVMEEIDRADFCQNDPYQDRPQSIGFNVTISAPHMHVIALELLQENLLKGKKCLDVGSGSGYLTLAFCKLMLQGKKQVSENEIISYGIEHIPELVQQSIQNISKNYQNLLENQNIFIQEGDGRLGLKQFAPYDAIHVGTASEEILPSLIEQLAFGGRLLIPVGKQGYQDFMIIDKNNNGEIKKTVAFGVTYVPLTSKEKQLKQKY